MPAQPPGDLPALGELRAHGAMPLADIPQRFVKLPFGFLHFGLREAVVFLPTRCKRLLVEACHFVPCRAKAMLGLLCECRMGLSSLASCLGSGGNEC